MNRNRAEGNVAAETTAVILRRPIANCNRAVLNDSIGRIAAFKPRDEYKRLERGTRLTFCHSSAIELISAAPADHCANITSFRLHGDYCALRLNNPVSVGVVFGQIHQQSLFRHFLHI